jgi:glycosyltransferase involved in cell wall biosynthesis
MVFTIHDLIHLRMPEERSLAKRIYFHSVVLPAARRAYCVLTVSEYSRREILSWTGLSPERVVVTPNGVDPSYSPEGPAKDFGARYLLYVGNRKPHKNLDRMFEAFRGVRDQKVLLVLTGDPEPDVLERAARAGIVSRLIFSGVLPDAEMPSLYRGAEALIIPSLLEGFGLPVIEAMASGTPVIAARTTALPEVAGDAAILVDPLNVAEIRDGMEAAAGNQPLRGELRARGLRRVSEYTWERAATRVNQVLCAASGPHGKLAWKMERARPQI